MTLDFTACAPCAAKPRAPTLCASCVHNRHVIMSQASALGTAADAFRRGAVAAADVAATYHDATSHLYRLDDCILAKLNLGRKRPRRNARRLQAPTDAWLCGVAVALAEMHRRLIGGNDSTSVCAIARASGLTLATAHKVGVSAFDLKELRKAGVR